MNVYEVITARIIESLSEGVVPWRRPWRVDAPKNLISGRDSRRGAGLTGDLRDGWYILDQFSKGTLRTIASARVLNEGIDVPDARVAIIVAGSQGKREHVQRIGRVLRPAPGKHALVYELVTAETSDARRAHTRGKNAPGSSAQFPSTRG